MLRSRWCTGTTRHTCARWRSAGVATLAKALGVEGNDMLTAEKTAKKLQKEVELSARISLLCQWSDDTIGWTSTLTKEACTPKMQPDDYMHSGAIPFATLVF